MKYKDRIKIELKERPKKGTSKKNRKKLKDQVSVMEILINDPSVRQEVDKKLSTAMFDLMAFRQVIQDS